MYTYLRLLFRMYIYPSSVYFFLYYSISKVASYSFTFFYIFITFRVSKIQCEPTRISFAFRDDISWQSFWTSFFRAQLLLGLAACPVFLHPYLNRGLPFVHNNLSLATF